MEKQIDTKKEEKTTHILAMHSVAEHSSTVLRMSKGEFMCECELYAWQKKGVRKKNYKSDDNDSCTNGI